MRRKLDKKPIILASAALALTGALTVGSAMAYFTTYSTASGGVTMNMGFTETKPNENVDKDGKHVTIENIGKYDCFVRVKVFSELTDEPEVVLGEGWYAGEDGYYYYKPILPGRLGDGDDETFSTTELLVKYKFPAGEQTEEFNIVVVQECTPVLFDENGNPYAN